MFSKIFPKIHSEGYKFLVIAGIITIVLYSFSDFLGLIGFVLTIWVYYFFRDPERVIIEDDNYLVSPADGEIIKVDEVDGPLQLGQLPHGQLLLALNHLQGFLQPLHHGITHLRSIITVPEHNFSLTFIVPSLVL